MASSVFVTPFGPVPQINSLTIVPRDPQVALTLLGDSGNQAIVEIHNAFAIGEDIYTHSDTTFRGPAVNFYRSKGTQAAPTAVVTNNHLGYLSFGGYDGSAYAQSLSLQVRASENWSSSAHGTYFTLATTLIGASSTAIIATMLDNGHLALSATAPTAVLHLRAGTATASSAPLKFTSGTNLTTAEAGAMEYNGTNLFFTRAGTTREGVLTQSAVTTEVLVPDTSVTVNIGGTTYKLLARA